MISPIAARMPPPNCSMTWCWSNGRNTIPALAPICPIRNRTSPTTNMAHPMAFLDCRLTRRSGSAGAGDARRERFPRDFEAGISCPPLGRSAVQLMTKLPLRRPTVGEGLAIDEDAGREHDPSALRELLALGGAEVERRDREAVLRGEPIEDLLGLVAERTVPLGQQGDLHCSGRGSPESLPDVRHEVGNRHEHREVGRTTVVGPPQDLPVGTHHDEAVAVDRKS